jgi:hypothetical protein
MNTPSSSWKWGIGIVIVLIVAVTAYLGLRHHDQKSTLATAETASAPAPAASAPVEQHPISDVQVHPAHASTAPLPALDHSDGMVRDALTTLSGKQLDALLSGKALIPRIVATINALPDAKLSPQMVPVHSPRGAFAVTQNKGGTIMATANAHRYDRYVEPFLAVDNNALVTWYVRNYPLFEEAWKQLGIPQKHFNDRLITVIDLLLATPTPDKPPQLVAENGNYVFANPQLERLSAGQKIMLRLDAKQENQVKAKLTALRAMLVGKQFPAASASAATAASSG